VKPILRLPGLLFAALFVLTLPASAVAQDAADVGPAGSGGESQAQVARGPSAEELRELASELGIDGSDEAVLLVYSTVALDLLRVGARLVAPEPLTPAQGVRQVVRGLSEGVVALELSASGRSWEGQVQVYKSAVTVLDVDKVLLTSASVPDAQLQSEAVFDLFGFYDELDSRTSIDKKLAYCGGVLASISVGPDRTLVQQACGRFERKKQEQERREEELTRLVAEPDQLVDALTEDPADDETELTLQPLLYRSDGTLRVRPRGTAVRAIVASATFAMAGASVAGALYWEYRAQQEYLLFRKAEQFGEDTQMTEHLYYTQQHDIRRNVAIGLGTAALTAGIVALVLQKLESERFRKARAALKGSAGAAAGGVR